MNPGKPPDWLYERRRRIRLTETTSPYTCSDYRKEMILIGLVRRLKQEDLTEEERRRIKAEIQALQVVMNLD